MLDINKQDMKYSRQGEKSRFITVTKTVTLFTMKWQVKNSVNQRNDYGIFRTRPFFCQHQQ